MIPHPALTIIPDFTAPPRFAISEDTEQVRLSAAEALVLYPEPEPTRMFTHRFKLTTRAEIEELKAFFSGRAGRCRPFYLPSWRDDLTLTASDANTITVTDPATPQGHGDSYGRTLFIWEGEDLHVCRWTQKTDNGATWTYYLETPLEFTPTPGLAMVGYAHLVRFAEDRLRLQHHLPYIAEAEIGFRSQRAWSGVEDTVTLTPIVHNESPGFQFADIEADELAPYEPRVCYALGPATLRTPATPSNRWACWLGPDGIPQMKKTLGTITLPDNTGTQAALFSVAVPIERLSLAFNHDGIEFIAYQDGPEINLRWWAGATEEQLWIGHDPILAYNWFTDTLMASFDAEIVCFYRKEGDNRLYARYEDDDFSVEYEAATLPVKPMELRALNPTNHINLILSDANWRLCTLRTE